MEQLYRQHYHAALLYCTSLCGNVHTAQDIVADAFVKAYLSLPRAIPSFQYWLFRVCKNLWIDQCRKQKYLSPGELPENLADHRTPESLYIQGQQKQALWKLLSTLPPLDKELVTLHYFSGLPLNEIASLMGKSYAAVRQRLARLRQELKKKLEEQGYGT